MTLAFLFLTAFFQNTKVEHGQMFKPCVIQMDQDHVATIYKMEIVVDLQIIRAIARSKLRHILIKVICSLKSGSTVAAIQ